MKINKAKKKNSDFPFKELGLVYCQECDNAIKDKIACNNCSDLEDEDCFYCQVHGHCVRPWVFCSSGVRDI